MADGITNGQRAVAAFEAMHAYAQASRSGTSAYRDNASHAQECVAWLLCDLRHYADLNSGARFDEALAASREEHQRARRASPAQVTAVARAIEAHEARQRHQDGSGSPDAVADLRRYATARGLTIQEARAHLLNALITGLRYYADAHHLDFAAALAASGRGYTGQRLQEEGQFVPGRDTSRSAVLVASSAAPPFEPVATRQGVVTSITDAEWLLVRTAARIHELGSRQPGAAAQPDDLHDRRALSRALAAACGLTEFKILTQLKPQINARAQEIQDGARVAAELGPRHGIAGAEPYCRLDMDGHDSQLMEALGETEPTTDANALYRLSLIQAYAVAYQRAGAGPAELAKLNFPRNLPHPGRGPAVNAAPLSTRTGRRRNR